MISLEAEATAASARLPIPGTNKHGNIELLDAAAAARLPPGTVHVPDNATRKVAVQLGIFFAPTVVGFTREGGQPKPRYDGVVVWAQDLDKVLQGTREEKEILEAAE